MGVIFLGSMRVNATTFKVTTVYVKPLEINFYTFQKSGTDSKSESDFGLKAFPCFKA